MMTNRTPTHDLTRAKLVIITTALIILTVAFRLITLSLPWCETPTDPTCAIANPTQLIVNTFLRATTATVISLIIVNWLSNRWKLLLITLGFLVLAFALHRASITMMTDLSPNRRWPTWLVTGVDNLGVIANFTWPALIGFTIIVGLRWAPPTTKSPVSPPLEQAEQVQDEHHQNG